MKPFRVGVAAVEREDVKAAVRRAVDLLGGMEAFVSKGDNVVIKPNMFIDAPAETGKTTHPLLIVSLAEMAKEAGAAKVTVAERNFAFESLFSGCPEIHEYAELVNLDKAEHRHVAIKGARNLQHPVPIPRLIDEADVFINCPGIRTHALCRFSNALKNLMGILPAANTLHVHGYGLEESYLDLNRRRPSDLVVTDAFIGLEGNFPSGGEGKLLGYVTVAGNPLAADFTACRLLGIEPEGLPVIDEAVSRGEGPSSFDDIELLGDPVSPPETPVCQSPHDPSGFSERVKMVLGGECYACRWALAGGLTAVRDAAPELFEEAGERVRIIAGPSPKVADSPFNLYYGACANRARKETPGRGKGVYIPGCPPLAGFVRRGLQEVLRQPEGFVSAADLKIRPLEALAKEGFVEGVDWVQVQADRPADAMASVQRVLDELDPPEKKDRELVVLSRRGLGTGKGLRFLQRLAQYASLYGEGWNERISAGLDLAYLSTDGGMGAGETERLVHRMSFACRAVILPEGAPGSLLRALIDEHFGGIIVSRGDVSGMASRYEDLRREAARPTDGG